MIEQCLALSAGKGGVLKTTAATHVAGIAAAAGARVLLVDADPQGNAMFDLGYRSDGGAGLADALRRREGLRPLRGVRPGLDVVPGGPELDDLQAVCGRPDDWTRLDDALVEVADRYDLIVLDPPAREFWLRRMILTAASSLVVPSGVDRASRVGLADAARSINEVRDRTNPLLEVVAVFTGPLSAASTAMRARARARLGELIGDPDLVCQSVVRYAPLVAELGREHGLLATELAELSSIKAPSSTPLLAADWLALTDEILQRFDESRRARRNELALAP